MSSVATSPESTPLSLRELAEQLALEPLIGVSAAAKLLGMPPSNFTRDAKPRLIPIPVEGSATVYFRSEVSSLARELQERRRARKAKADGAPD